VVFLQSLPESKAALVLEGLTGGTDVQVLCARDRQANLVCLFRPSSVAVEERDGDLARAPLPSGLAGRVYTQTLAVREVKQGSTLSVVHTATRERWNRDNRNNRAFAIWVRDLRKTFRGDILMLGDVRGQWPDRQPREMVMDGFPNIYFATRNGAPRTGASGMVVYLLP
jgi:hypothetical protein